MSWEPVYYLPIQVRRPLGRIVAAITLMLIL